MSRPGWRSLRLLLVTLLSATCAHAQLQFEALTKRDEFAFPRELTQSTCVAAGDVDGDGDIDVVEGVRATWQRDQLLLNDGRGVFRTAGAAWPQDRRRTSDLELIDVDGDGDLDAAATTEEAGARLYLNDGQGRFSDVSATHLPVVAIAQLAIGLALSDLDGDGDVDWVVVSSGRPCRLMLNDGAGRFHVASSNALPGLDDAREVFVADVDGDQDGDLWFTSNGPLRLFVNDGAAGFTDETTARLPASRQNATLALGDVDGDGDADALVMSRSPIQTGELWLNDGRGQFRLGGGFDGTSRSCRDVDLIDIDADGDLDAVVTRFWHPDDLHLNDGTGRFVRIIGALPERDRASVESVFLDADADGDVDRVVVAFKESAYLELQVGAVRFVDADDPRIPLDDDNTYGVVLEDFDGDGDLDLFIANWIRGKDKSFVGEQDRIYVNDGTGRFEDQTPLRLPEWKFGVTSIVALDAEGDGDVDICLGGVRLLLNDGVGCFAPSPTFPSRVTTAAALAAGDVDGDGDVDLIVTDTINRLYLNDGAGNFVDDTAGRLQADGRDTTAVALGDVDGDGDLDLVIGADDYRSQLEVNRLFLNDGRGRFTQDPTQLNRRDARTQDVAFGDLDRDGDLDLVFGRGEEDAGNLVYLNDGSGRFADVTATNMPDDREKTWAVELGDVDGDGDLDCVTATWGARVGLFLNDGQGSFRNAATRAGSNLGPARAIALGDVDEDRDLDVVVGYEELDSSQTRLYTNLQRQLVTPKFARVGEPFSVEMVVRYAPSSRADQVIPFGATATAKIPLPPFGTLRLDPAQSFALPPFFLTAGTGAVRFTIPALPSLLDLTIYTQALYLPVAGPARLTNLTADGIRR